MIIFISKTYILLYIQYTFDNPTEDSILQSKKLSKNTSWFNLLRNDMLTQIYVNNNLITNYEPSELTPNMQEYKTFDLKSLYVRLIFSINKSKDISLYDVFLYYDIYMTPQDIDIVTKENGYPLNNIDLYKKDVQSLHKNSSDVEIVDLVKRQSSDVYYVYMYDIINNIMTYEFNTTKLENLHNIANKTSGGKHKIKIDSKNNKNVKKTIRSRSKHTKKTLRVLRK
jgi:hypothetical protein